MTRTISLTIAALAATAMSAGAAVPAIAQEQDMRSAQAQWHVRGSDGHGPYMMFRGLGGPDGFRFHFRDHAEDWTAERSGGGIVDLVCSERGADRLEHVLLGIEQRTDPTGEQKQLFDAFRSAALVAQTEFADACKASREAVRGDSGLNLPDRLRARLDIQKAHIAALSEVLPKFEAFYASLEEAQKQALEPRGGKRWPGERHRGPMHDDAPRAISPDRT
ncbi:MAG TPA: Spy/CpxP family protein refolding chaperone [Alphaproteobacteria bacterium]|nr:Spy/CpxP family protein refolding chaperone [Alphaproteobacteria bacterium]